MTDSRDDHEKPTADDPTEEVTSDAAPAPPEEATSDAAPASSEKPEDDGFTDDGSWEQPDVNGVYAGDNANEGANEGLPEDFPFDPQELMRDPMGVMMRTMQDPKAMQAVQAFMGSPKGQEMLAASLKNPMLKQMLGNNPLLGGLLGKGGSGFNPFSIFGGRGGATPPTNPAPPRPEPAPEPEPDPNDIDEPVIALLDPPQLGMHAFPDPAPLASWDDVLQGCSPTAREAVVELATARARHHLGDEGMARLEHAAKKRAVARPIDLLACQGALAGEVAWYAVCRLEEEHGTAAFTPLVRHALRCVTFNSGYRVPSFATQLLGVLIGLEALLPQDVRHVTWALSGQPRDQVDGVFEITWDDVDDLVAGVAGHEDVDDALLTAFLAALLGWKECDHDARPSAMEVALEDLPKARRKPVLTVLAELLGGREEQGVRGTHLPDPIAQAAAEQVARHLGVNHAITIANAQWDPTRHSAPTRGLLHVLDLRWHDAETEPRERFIDRVLESEDDALRALTYRVAAAWEPHTYLERAIEDTAADIRRWAEKEMETLR